MGSIPQKTVFQGDTVHLDFDLQEPDGSPLDITSAVVSWALTPYDDLETNLITKETGSGITHTTPLAGRARVTLTAGELDNPGTYYHELEATLSTGETYTYAQGLLIVKPAALPIPHAPGTPDTAPFYLTSENYTDYLRFLDYKGVWNASTNTPTLTSSAGTKGFYYVVSVSGSTTLNGISTWAVGDWAVYNGTSWEKVDNSSSDDVFTQSGTGAVNRTLQDKLRETVSALDFIPVTEHAGIAAYTSTTDVTTYLQAAINACQTSGASLYIPKGLYKTTDALDATNIVIYGDGMSDTFIRSFNATATDPVIYLGRTCHLSDICFQFDTSVLTGTEVANQRCSIITYSPTSGFVLQRGSALRSVRISQCGTGVSDGANIGGGCFSVTFDSIEIFKFTYRGWDFQSTTRTGNVYKNIYIHGGDEAGATDSVYASNIDCGFNLQGEESECSIDQLNVEWLHGIAAVRISSVHGLSCGTIHVEEFTQRGTYNGAVVLDEVSGSINALSFYYCPISVAGWYAVELGDEFHRTGGLYDPATSNYLRIGSLHCVGLNDGLKVLSGNGISALTDFYFVARESDATGTYRVRIDNFTWNTFEADQAVYESFVSDPHRELIFEGAIGPKHAARAVTSDQTDWSGRGTWPNDTITFTTDTNTRIISGITDGYHGRNLTLINTGSFGAILAHNSLSTAANRFDMGQGAGWLYLRSGASARFMYDAVASRWRLLSTSGATFLDDAFTIRDNSDVTKALQFSTGSITTATTRTLTVQDVSGTVYVSGGTDVLVADGGTGASTAADARTNLGLAIGTNVQAYDADLAAIAGLTSAADTLPYYTGSGAAALATFTGFGRSLVDDADAATGRATLAAAPAAATYIVQTANSELSSEQALSALSTGILKNTTGTGVLSIAAAGTDYYNPGGTDVAVADGGTGASTAAAARENLGVWSTAFKTTDETITSDSTYSDDSQLQVSVAANTKYSFEINIFFDTTAAADFKMQFTGPSSPTLFRMHHIAVAAAGTSFASNRIDSAYAAIAVLGAGAGAGVLHLWGTLHNGSNAGTLVIQWAQDTSDASNTTVRAGSYIKWAKVA